MIPIRNKLTFPGNRKEKGFARIFLYKHALQAPLQGHAVTLAGTEPEAEITLLRDYLKWPTQHTWFVDSSKKPEVLRALDRIPGQWPGVNVERDNLYNVIPKLGAIGFANLDFMGAPLQDETFKCFTDVNSCLLPGAILGFTWMRGREQLDWGKAAQKLWKLGKGFRGNDRRWAGFLNAVETTSKGTLKLLDKMEYMSHHSPMALAVFRKEHF